MTDCLAGFLNRMFEPAIKLAEKTRPAAIIFLFFFLKLATSKVLVPNTPNIHGCGRWWSRVDRHRRDFDSANSLSAFIVA